MTEYHDKMSVPAIEILTELNYKIEEMYLETTLYSLGITPSNERQQNARSSIFSLIDKYDKLTFAKDSFGHNLAWDSMQNMMQTHVIEFNNIFDEFDDMAQNLIVMRGSKDVVKIHNEVENLNPSRKEFHSMVDKSLQMEINGKNYQVEKTETAEQQINSSIIISIIISVVTIIILSVILSNNISKPLLILKKVIDEIGKGNIETKIKINGDFETKQIAIGINKMTESLQTHIHSIEEHERVINESLYVDNINKKLIERQLEELKQTDKQKDEFATMISHELKTPLVPIKGYAEMLKDPDIAGNLTSEQLEYVNEIYDHSERLEALIGDVLDTQKLAMGQMTFNQEKFSVGEFLTKIMRDSTSLMTKKQIQFEVNPIEKITINSDKNRLHQVLDNLIRNAVDFVPKNTGKIEIGVTDKDNEITFYVKDNGIGIPKDKQNNLFKKFYQVDTSQTREHGGTGLGLVICKGIVEGLGGKMWVESDGDGTGTTFYFTIPKN
ncbi:MAG: HAMP domain-containing protein [Nitrosopumilus sp.]|nr:HAMP domain-containing protein [Nitrosopumilus sp.]